REGGPLPRRRAVRAWRQCEADRAAEALCVVMFASLWPLHPLLSLRASASLAVDCRLCVLPRLCGRWLFFACFPVLAADGCSLRAFPSLRPMVVLCVLPRRCGRWLFFACFPVVAVVGCSLRASPSLRSLVVFSSVPLFCL